MKDVLKTLDFPEGRAVLFDSANEGQRVENISCLNLDGSLRWQAALPANTGPDSFVDVAIDGHNLRAVTWSGWAIWFDRSTGSVIKSTFVK